MNAIQLYENIITLAELYEKIAPLPRDSILFGMATDQEPVLMSVSETKGSNVIVWDRIVGQGIKLIKCAIEFILRYKTGKRTEFVIMSNRTKEWERLNENGLGVWNDNECIAIVPFWDIVADKVLFALAGWTRGIRETASPIILFIDGLENIDRMGQDSKNWLRYVMLFGRKKNIYVVGTAKSESREHLQEWMEGFQAEIFGQGKLHWFEMDKPYGTINFYTPRTTI